MAKNVSPVEALKDELLDKLIDEIEDTGDESKVQFLTFDEPIEEDKLEQRIQWHEEDHPKCEILYVCAFGGVTKKDS